MTEYHKVDLFGGAIVASLPIKFGDVSDLRTIPDHQEVYLDRSGFTNIVIEILERVDFSSDHDALHFHLKDLVEESDMPRTKIFSELDAHCAKLPNGTPARTLLAMAPAGERQRGRENEPDFVGLVLTMIRLEQQATDLLVCVNVPHKHGEYDPAQIDLATGQIGSLMQTAIEYRDTILQTLEIHDWSLFV